jgi:signal transduction histidine kinase
MTYPDNQKIVSAETESDFQSYTELPNNKPLAIVDLKLKIVYCNDSFKRYFGLDVSDEISQMNSNPEFVYILRKFNDSHYKNAALDINLASENEQVVQNFSVSIERVVIRSSQYFILTVESLEHRRRIENKINSFHNALDQGNVPIMILDANRRVTYVTKSFESILSKEIENIYGKEIYNVLDDIFDQKDLYAIQIAFEQFQKWKKVVFFNGKLFTEFWEFILNPVLTGDDLHPSFILTANNLTEHINQTKAVERSEKKQKLIINNISDLLLIVEHIGVATLFENANDNFCQIFGLDKTRTFTSKIDDILPDNLTKEIYTSIFTMVQKNETVGSFSYKHIDNNNYLCKITSISERERESIIYIITMKDITEEVLYREQLKKAYHKEMQLNKMKSDFLANMSHEIRTPFNAVVGFSEIIDECLETNDYEPVKELMESMKEVLGRALNLFTNIIEVSQIEAGEIEIERVDLNCNAIIRNIIQKKEEEAKHKKLELILDLSPDDCLIEVDWVKFEKVINSLVDNAIKYTNEGYLYIGTKKWRGWVDITISDTGVGIEKNQLERLLRPFTQEVEGYTRPFEGAGLGLTIAYKLTQLMGGRFEISSEKDRGTKIIVSFPSSI